MATTASYPGNIVNFGLDKVNVVDLVQASDPNTLRAEVVAIETTLGTSPSLSTAPAYSATWYNDARDFNTVNARLNNIEAGIVADTHTQYVKNAGGSSIVVSSASVIGLSIKAATSQTADLMQWKNSSGTVVTRVGPDGILYASGGQVGGSSSSDFTGNFLFGGM
jgi:hypothetical protein